MSSSSQRTLPNGGACWLLLLLALPARAARLTPPQLLRDMAGQFATYRDYQVLMFVETPSRKPKRREYVLEFLRRRTAREADMLRLNVRSGKEDGADFIVRQDGSIRMRGGGLINKHFPVSVRRDDPRLQLAEDLWLWQADFGSLTERLTAFCDGASSCLLEDVGPAELKRLAREDPRHPVWEERTGAYRLRAARTDEMGSPVQIELLVSRVTTMPLRYSVSRGGQMVERFTFSHLRANTGKKAGRFRF